MNHDSSTDACPHWNRTLNPQNASHFLASDPDFFTSFSLIIAANQPPSVLKPLSDLAWGARDGVGIPLMDVRGAGLLGRVRVQIKESGSELISHALLTSMRYASDFLPCLPSQKSSKRTQLRQ